MMLKKNLLWMVVLVVIVGTNMVNGFLIDNVTLYNSKNSVLINNSMNLEALNVSSEDIDLYNATSEGQINNNNDTETAIVRLHLKYPYDTVILEDNSTIYLNVEDKNITINANGWARIQLGGLQTFIENNWEELLGMFGVLSMLGLYVWYRGRS